MLKQLRSSCQEAAFQLVLASTQAANKHDIDEDSGVLEHPMLTELFDVIVHRGHFEDTIQLLERIHATGLSLKATRQQTELTIERDTCVTVSHSQPSARTGHSVALDGNSLWIFGGCKYDDSALASLERS